MSGVTPIIATSLLRVALSSVVASVVVVIAFTLAILGRVRGSETRAAGRSLQAFWYSMLTVGGLAAFAASVVYGLVLVTKKS
jgi:hypothetical protein